MEKDYHRLTGGVNGKERDAASGIATKKDAILES